MGCFRKGLGAQKEASQHIWDESGKNSGRGPWKRKLLLRLGALQPEKGGREYRILLCIMCLLFAQMFEGEISMCIIHG